MVNSRLLQPQEIEVFYVLPAIRRAMAMVMKEQGRSQREIAQILRVNESAVSQYMSSKRAAKITFDDSILKAIRETIPRLNSKQDLVKETQHVLNLARNSRVVCGMHKKFAKFPVDCNPVEMGCLKGANISISYGETE